MADDPHDPQLLKGVLSLLLLHLLAERESYGYEIVQRLHSIGLNDVATGTVYPALSRLEKERWLKARLVPSNEGPARKYYQPTPVGLQALGAATSQWNSLVAVVARQLSRPITTPPKGR